MSGLFLKCLICEDKADSNHFGATSCRACAAFFRRAVAGNRKIRRHCEGKCAVSKNYRRLCAYCRFKKCSKYGMKQEAVESKASYPGCSHLPSPEELIFPKIFQAYENLEKEREAMFHVDNESLPQVCNYELLDKIESADMKLITESLLKVFLEISNLPEDQEKIIQSHFLPSFVLLERSFRSTNSTFEIIPNRYYLNFSEIKEFYSKNKNENGDGEKAYKFLGQYWRKYENMCWAHINEVKLDKSEAVYLSALLFWDFGILGQSDECIEICVKYRSKILNEFTEYERKKCVGQDYCVRIADVMMTLHFVQRNLHLLYECGEIIKVYDIRANHVLHKYCA